jgi:hypothetical protein
VSVPNGLALTYRPAWWPIDPSPDSPPIPIPASLLDGAWPLSWRTLEDLESRADVFRSEVEMVGYMFSIDHARGQGAAVQRFLLVPDAGNWLSAPHFHPDEVVEVRLKSGRTVPVIDRKPVLVRGILSVESADLKVARLPFSPGLSHSSSKGGG